MHQGGKNWILGVDTSRKGIHLSLLKPDGSDERFLHNLNARGEALAGELTTLFQENGVTLSEIQTVIATLGPGSFTGLRTGIAFCQGLCATGERNLIGVSTLAFFRHQRPQLEFCACLLYARPGHWYLENGKELFLSEKQVLSELGCIKTVLSDQEKPVSGPLTEWNGDWIKLDTEWRFSAILPIIGQFESSLVLQANYLQPSYAER